MSEEKAKYKTGNIPIWEEIPDQIKISMTDIFLFMKRNKLEKYELLDNGHNKFSAKPYKKDMISSEVRWLIWERDNFTCQKCGSRKNLTIDHIIPESKGGKTEIKNLQTLCRPCNSKKGSK